jgi:phosphomannomutase/phosphoglucomutase
VSIYREYDIRGVFEKELNRERVIKIGFLLSKRVDGEFVVVGYDARTHSPKLFEWLSIGLNSGGKKVFSIGIVPTPVNYFCNYLTVKELSGGEIEESGYISGSIMITGSHNPSEYNGFKITINQAPFFGEDIYALGDEVEAMKELPEVGERRIVEIDVLSRYKKYIVEEFSHLKGLKYKVVYDCGNGVAGVILPKIFEELNIDAEGIYVEPDGDFPNHHPDPSVEKNLEDIKALLKKGGDVAFAYDGDADRIAVLTHKHNIKGDQMAILFAKLMDRPTVIGEVKCSSIMYSELERVGAKAVMYKTGHSNLKVKMRELNADLACEVSGHIFFKDRYFGYDDAIYATFRFLELLKNGIDVDSELDSLPKLYSTEEIKIPTTEDEKFKVIERIREILKDSPEMLPKIVNIVDIDGLRIEFEDGWALVRASNTTPVLVTRFEASSKDVAERYEEMVALLIKEAKSTI